MASIFFRCLLAPVATLACLSGCSAPHREDTTVVKAKSEIKRAAKTGLSLVTARLVLPAVTGHPGAAYFTMVNNGTADATLVGATVEGAARSEMHETMGTAMKPLAAVVIAPGAGLAFVPGGRHVMAFGLAKSLAPGGTGQITLQFADGRKVSGPMRVDAAGSEDSSGAPMSM